MTLFKDYWHRRSERARSVLAACLCFTILLAIYGVTSRASAYASDEIAVFRTGVALFTEGHLYIDDLTGLQHITPIATRGVGGHLYAIYFPGNTISAGVLYALTARSNDQPYVSDNPHYSAFELAPSQFGARIALRLNALLGAFGMTMLLLFLKKRFDWRTAVVTVLLISLTTDWWSESRMFYSEIGAGAFLIASLYFADSDNPWLSSLFFAISLQYRPTNLIALPVWLYSIWRKNWKAALSGVFIAGGLAFLALYNFARYYSFFNFGYGANSFSTPLLVGLEGVLFSPGHSLFVYSPIVLLAVMGSILFHRVSKALFYALLLSILGYIVLAASWESWFGGTVWGSRLVVPIIPLLGILVGATIHEMFTRPARPLLAMVIALGTIGLGIQLLTIIQSPLAAFREFTQNGYATQDDAIWSVSKNWLALEIKALANWNSCNIDAYTLRSLFSQCK